ncbi:hypothetical protein DFH08DRAFT_839995, partial [Mycena albidolilacea]
MSRAEQTKRSGNSLETELTEEEHSRRAEMQHRKRQRIDVLYRPLAQQALDSIGNLYGPLGALNLQIGEATYVDNLYSVRADSNPPKIEGQSQKMQDARYSQTPDPESDHDPDHELSVQVRRLNNRLLNVVHEHNNLEELCEQFRQAFQQVDKERSQLCEELQRWVQAATAALMLTKLLTPYS